MVAVEEVATKVAHVGRAVHIIVLPALAQQPGKIIENFRHLG